MTGRQSTLIWFQHFHKAGGTSLIELAKINGERLYPTHLNGNPVDGSGVVIPLWKYDAKTLAQFVTHCIEQGVTLVCTEWGLPLIEELAKDPRVTTVTLVRDPLRRFLSNFRYDVTNGYTKKLDIYTYLEEEQKAHTQFNYYCRILARMNYNSLEEVTESHFEEATRTLSQFDMVMVLEDRDSFKRLWECFSWKLVNKHSNKTNYSAALLGRQLLGGKIGSIARSLLSRRLQPPDGFEEFFESSNEYDRGLYSYALQRARSDASKTLPGTPADRGCPVGSAGCPVGRGHVGA